MSSCRRISVLARTAALCFSLLVAGTLPGSAQAVAPSSRPSPASAPQPAARTGVAFPAPVNTISPASAPAERSSDAVLSVRLDALWQREPLPSRAFIGLAVADPESGAVLYTRNATNLFTPASNAKLFSTALALSRLGPEYRVATEILAEGAYDTSSGLLRGQLVLRGAGDPSLSSRRFPYSKQAESIRDYPIPALEELADALVTRGLRTVTGDVVGDDTAYLWQPFHEGWAQDDALYDYGAPVSALTVNDNFVELGVTPGPEPGTPASFTVRPALPYYDILNRVTTVASGGGRIQWETAPHRQLLVSGSIAPGMRPWRGHIAIDDPALYAACYLRDALARRGVTIAGTAVARHRYEGEVTEPAASVLAPPLSTVLVRRESPPVAEIIRSTNKESVNLFAELLLREVARARTGLGSRKAGLDELTQFLSEIGVSPDAAYLADGSGLARLSLVSPEATIRLLGAMWKSPYRDVFLASLPVAAADGTLARRFTATPRASAIRAKTGTLHGVSSLSGYVSTDDGRTLAFSAFVNNHPGTARIAREFLDKIALELASARLSDAR